MKIHRILLLTLVLLTALALSFDASAMTVADVNVPDSATIGAAKDKVMLNGAGIRKKYGFKIYVGALYLKERATDRQKALDMTGPKRILMHILYSEVSDENLNAGWDDGFKKNLPKDQYKAMKPRLRKFMSLFRTATRGTRILIDYVPGEGTKVSYGGKHKGTVEGEDFYRALMLVYLGDKPADKRLKKGMLGL